MELPDGRRAHIAVADEDGGARSIKRNVGRKGSARIPHLLEPLHTRIERGLASARKSHHRDAGRVDAGMAGEHVEGAITIEDHVKTAEQRLIGGRADDPAPRETVDEE
jgi:hypothetical protein